MSLVLLLTATIKPFMEGSESRRTDSIAREDDYFKAIKFYLEKGYKVVFVENSNYYSSRISSLNEKFTSLEYHCFLSQKSYLGKSFGEIEIIEYAMKHSNFLSEVDYLIKITGRYIIKNINSLLDKTNNIEHEIYINPTRNFRWADTRIIIIRKSYYNNFFLPCAEKYLDESKKVFLENVLMRSLFFYMIEGGNLILWPVYPAYDGFDGTHDEKVSFGTFKTWKYNLYYKIKKFVFRHRA
jgi:hypothetical protein